MGTRIYLLFAAIAVAAMVLGTGCRNRSRSGRVGMDSDSGPTTIDSGTPPMTDSGGIVLMDSGPPPMTDSGGPMPDCFSDTDCLSSQMCAGGACVPRETMSCRSNTVPPWSGTACSEATRTCITDCGSDNACANACVDADVPDCGACIQNQSIVCYNRMGCQDEWNCFWQCVEDNGCMDRSCVTSFCGPEDSTYSACAMAVPGSCTELNDCFPS